MVLCLFCGKLIRPRRRRQSPLAASTSATRICRDWSPTGRRRALALGKTDGRQAGRADDRYPEPNSRRVWRSADLCQRHCLHRQLCPGDRARCRAVAVPRDPYRDGPGAAGPGRCAARPQASAQASDGGAGPVCNSWRRDGDLLRSACFPAGGASGGRAVHRANLCASDPAFHLRTGHQGTASPCGRDRFCRSCPCSWSRGDVGCHIRRAAADHLGRALRDGKYCHARMVRGRVWPKPFWQGSSECWA